MGSSYLQNHFGMQLSEAEFEDIPYPKAELITHVTQKTVQAGALLGTTLFGPLAAVARSSTRNMEGIVRTSTRYGRNGILIGFVLGPIATHLRTKNLTEVQIVDRDYRLRHNRGQVRVDRGAVIGGVLGAGLCAAISKPVMLGAVIGISAGILDMAIYNNYILKDSKK